MERNEDLKEQRRRNPKRYWIEMNKLLGKEKRGVSGYRKEVKEKKKMDAENWKRTHEMVVQELDESIQRTEVEEAVGKMKSGKAPGEDRITAELLKGVNSKCITALWLMFKRCYETEEIPRLDGTDTQDGGRKKD